MANYMFVLRPTEKVHKSVCPKCAERGEVLDSCPSCRGSAVKKYRFTQYYVQDRPIQIVQVDRDPETGILRYWENMSEYYHETTYPELNKYVPEVPHGSGRSRSQVLQILHRSSRLLSSCGSFGRRRHRSLHLLHIQVGLAALEAGIHQHRQHKAQAHEQRTEEHRAFLEHIRSLGTKGLVSHLGTSVLKDASSTSIYGARAANGVIVITTKRGRNMDRPNIRYNMQLGVSSLAHGNWDLMNTAERIQYEKEKPLPHLLPSRLLAGCFPAFTVGPGITPGQCTDVQSRTVCSPPVGNRTPP